MGVNKDFKDRDIIYEIDLKAKTIDVVRTARVLASDRLYGYAEKWELIFLLMSIVSTGLLILSIITPEDSYRLSISASFSIYSLLVQNFISKVNYNERALKYHYHQLELEKLLLELKYLLMDSGLSENEKFAQHKIIMDKYQMSLQGYENHSNLDHKKARRRSKEHYDQQGASGESILKRLTRFFEYKDLSWNMVFIHIQYLIIALVVMMYFWK